MRLSTPFWRLSKGLARGHLESGSGSDHGIYSFYMPYDNMKRAGGIGRLGSPCRKALR